VSGYPSQTRSYAPAACCYRGSRRPLFEHKPEETSPHAHGVGWFMSLAFGFGTFASQKTELPLLTTVCSGQPDTVSNDISGLTIFIGIDELCFIRLAMDAGGQIFTACCPNRFNAGKLFCSLLPAHNLPLQRFSSARCPNLTWSSDSGHRPRRGLAAGPLHFIGRGPRLCLKSRLAKRFSGL